jgi:hypothetical protein
MEAFELYLLKSVIWLKGFDLIYLVFQLNERYLFRPKWSPLVRGILI